MPIKKPNTFKQTAFQIRIQLIAGEIITEGGDVDDEPFSYLDPADNCERNVLYRCHIHPDDAKSVDQVRLQKMNMERVRNSLIEAGNMILSPKYEEPDYEK